MHAEMIADKYQDGRGRKMERTPTLGNELVFRREVDHIDRTPTDARSSPFVEFRDGVEYRVHEGYVLPGGIHVEIPAVQINRYKRERDEQ